MRNLAGAIVAAAAGTYIVVRLRRAMQNATTDEMVPAGVNVGGWLNLEDWFYSSPETGKFVATPPAETCFDPSTFVGDVYAIFPGLTRDERSRLKRRHFGSESDLIRILSLSGIPLSRIAELFQQHRSTYVTPLDFARLRVLGIKCLRVPVTWCIAYDTPYSIYGVDSTGRDVSCVVGPDSTIVNDPFTNHTVFADEEEVAQCADKWAAIPASHLEEILEKAAANDIRVLFDFHCFPGGSAEGTFNGISPLPSRFWTAHYKENFRVIIDRMLRWMEGLSDSNPRAFGALYGLAPMNEPAHMYGLQPPKASDGALLAPGFSPDAMLETLSIAVEEFRRRPRLAASGKRCVMNVIGTAWPECFGSTPIEGQVFAATPDEGVDGAIGHWWREVTTEQERVEWAELDVHFYIAWDPRREMLLNAKSEMEHALAFAACGAEHFYANLRKSVGCPSPQLVSCSEFSASADHLTTQSVNSGVGSNAKRSQSELSWFESRDLFLRMQVSAARAADVRAWFWTYSIHNNINYQSEWSLAHILLPRYRLARMVGSKVAQGDVAWLLVHVAHSVKFAARVLTSPTAWQRWAWT
jgi:hypothetical protein